MKKDEQAYFESSIPRDRFAMRKKARDEFGKLVESIDVQRSSSQQTAYAQEVERRLNQLEIFAKCVDKIEREIAKNCWLSIIYVRKSLSSRRSCFEVNRKSRLRLLNHIICLHGEC